MSTSDRAFLTRQPGAALPEDYATHPGTASLVHVHISELTTLLEYPDLPGQARAAGLTVSLDCGWDDEALARTDLHAILAGIDVFLPNEPEHEALARQVAQPAAAALLTVVKRGAAGAHGA